MASPFKFNALGVRTNSTWDISLDRKAERV